MIGITIANNAKAKGNRYKSMTPSTIPRAISIIIAYLSLNKNRKESASKNVSLGFILFVII